MAKCGFFGNGTVGWTEFKHYTGVCNSRPNCCEWHGGTNIFAVVRDRFAQSICESISESVCESICESVSESICESINKFLRNRKPLNESNKDLNQYCIRKPIRFRVTIRYLLYRHPILQSTVRPGQLLLYYPRCQCHTDLRILLHFDGQLRRLQHNRIHV
jgi:hypothetical protein